MMDKETSRLVRFMAVAWTICAIGYFYANVFAYPTAKMNLVKAVDNALMSQQWVLAESREVNKRSDLLIEIFKKFAVKDCDIVSVQFEDENMAREFATLHKGIIDVDGMIWIVIFSECE